MFYEKAGLYASYSIKDFNNARLKIVLFHSKYLSGIAFNYCIIISIYEGRLKRYAVVMQMADKNASMTASHLNHQNCIKMEFISYAINVARND